LGILVGTHGRGSNMNAIIDACTRGDLDAEVALVVSPIESNQAVESAKFKGVPVRILPYAMDDYAQALVQALKDAGCFVVCLAGYMRLLPKQVLDAFPGRVLNIHPALLPKFGGKGMYGMRVHEAVVASGETESGCTVHFVNERYDEGAILLQLKCSLSPSDTPDNVAAKVLKLEHQAYPMAIQELINRYAR